MNKYLCKIHKQMNYYQIIPMSPQYNICTYCLKKNIKGYSDPLLPISSIEYNYIFPMVCDLCSLKLKTCKWCRVPRYMVLP